MTIATPNDEVLVRNLLATAGVPATEEEIALVITNYERLKSMVNTLHAVSEARYESPAMHFVPTPTFAQWG